MPSRVRAALFAVVVTLVAFAAIALTPGCGDIAPGADRIVVRGEQGITTTFGGVDLFLKAEHDNRAWVAAELPDVHAIAERLRTEFPPAEREAVAALKLYRRTRLSADADAAEAKRAIVAGLAAEARKQLDRINERKARR